MHIPSSEVIAFGEKVCSAMMDASIRRGFAGMGGCKEYDPNDFDADVLPYIDAYLTTDLGSVALIYAAMRDKEADNGD